MKFINSIIYRIDIILLRIWENHLIPDKKLGWKEKDIIGKIAGFLLNLHWNNVYGLDRIICRLVGCDEDWNLNELNYDYCCRCAKRDDDIIDEEDSILYKIKNKIEKIYFGNELK